MSGKFKTAPLEHQLACLNKFGRRQYWANASEQGTGKTWIAINNVADLWSTGDLNGVLVFAPSGVHYNWVLRELPKHMPDYVRYRSAAWNAAAKKKERDHIESVLGETDSSVLRILVMNVESLATERGVNVAERFASSCSKLMIIVDESQAFKNPKANRTKALMKLRRFSKWRRIMTGTPITNAPFDLFSQYTFLSENIFNTSSFFAFKSEYGEMLDPSHPLVRNIGKKNVERRGARRVPQICERDENGRPIYRNLDKLTKLIAPYTFRVLKSDCLDLPEKIYKYVWFDMTAEQRRVYDYAAKEHRLALNGEDTAFTKLVAQMKLMQITSGYYLHPEQEEPVRIDGPNPKLELLIDRIKSVIEMGEKVIVWARFRVQIEDIAAALRDEEIEAVQYHGGVKRHWREVAIDSFENDSPMVFIGQQQSGGRGLTLVAASNVFYFSNTYGLEDRQQSEDRAHRIGQNKSVVYVDFCAVDSVDYECIESLRSKANVAAEVLGPIEER